MSEAPPTRRRWLQFGLLSFLGFIAVVSAGFAWVANERRQSRYEFQVVEELRATNQRADVRWGGSFDPPDSIVPLGAWMDLGAKPSWWRQTLSRLCGQRVYELNIFGNSQVTDLAPLGELKNLLRLDVSRTPVSDFSPLARLTSLQCLNLYQTKISDLAPLAGLKNLKHLAFGGTLVRDLSPLARLTRLESIDLHDTPVADLAPLAGLDEALISVVFNGTQVHDLSPLAGLKNLLSLQAEHTLVTDITPLAGLGRLTGLNSPGK
jgi:hypothetical protein